MDKTPSDFHSKSAYDKSCKYLRTRKDHFPPTFFYTLFFETTRLRRRGDKAAVGELVKELSRVGWSVNISKI